MSAKDLRRDELESGAQKLREKVRAWQPGLILFVFGKAASTALGSRVSPGKGPSLEGVPTFLLSGPYASRNEADRLHTELRAVLSVTAPGVPQDITSQRVTEADLKAGVLRLPRNAKALLPVERGQLQLDLRGTPLTASYDPKVDSDRERSGVLRVGKEQMSRLVAVGDRLRVSKGPNGRLQLD